MKTCNKCGVQKPLSEFVKDKSRKDGINSCCKICRKQYDIKNKSNRNNYVSKNREKILRQVLDYSYKRKYGISLDHKNSMIQKQNGLCDICNKKMEGSNDFCVDHCHNTNEIRGILCRKCNLGIGHLDDSIDLLKSAIKYLKKHQKN